MLFDGPDELEWIDLIEVEAGKSSLGYVIFSVIVGMTFESAINIDPQFKLFRLGREAVRVAIGRAWTIVV
jgi:hypothetical protein